MITHLSHPVAGDMDTAADSGASQDMVSETVHLFKLLADDTRLWILHYLSRAGELHVRALCKASRPSAIIWRCCVPQA
jgi:hypothetical protein